MTVVTAPGDHSIAAAFEQMAEWLEWQDANLLRVHASRNAARAAGAAAVSRPLRGVERWRAPGYMPQRRTKRRLAQWVSTA